MTGIDDRLLLEIAAIGADSRSGATALLMRAVAVLRAAAAVDRDTLVAAAEGLSRAQPSMAGLRVAASIAHRAEDPIAALDRFAERTARAPRLIARHAAELLKLRRRTGVVRLVTCSRSHAVEQAIRALAVDTPLEVACSESRPALEGRELAGSLADAGVRVTFYTDAGVATALAGAEAFLSGADAVGPRAFINKVGTGALAALAAAEGVPTYVLAGREKILSTEMFSDLRLAGGPVAEVWSSAPAGVRPANPYFEQVQNTLVAAFVTDGGVVPVAEIAGLCNN